MKTESLTSNATPAVADTSVADSPLTQRAGVHRALGDASRLRIVDALQLSDRSPKELASLTGLAANLLAFHLDVLEDAGVIGRTASQGDARRRYVHLVAGRLAAMGIAPAPSTTPEPQPAIERVLFVCTANSARSQLAAHLWQSRTGLAAMSAGTEPAPHVHPNAVAVASAHGLDLGAAVPVDALDVAPTPDLVVSVCDRAHESGLELGAPRLHWSVPDPVGGGVEAFTRAFEELTDRVDRLARSLVRST